MGTMAQAVRPTSAYALPHGNHAGVRPRWRDLNRQAGRCRGNFQCVAIPAPPDPHPPAPGTQLVQTAFFVRLLACQPIQPYHGSPGLRDMAGLEPLVAMPWAGAKARMTHNPWCPMFDPTHP